MNTDFVAIQIHRDTDDELDVILVKENGELVVVGSANHDEHGWAGMDAVSSLAEMFAIKLGLDLIET